MKPPVGAFLEWYNSLNPLVWLLGFMSAILCLLGAAFWSANYLLDHHGQPQPEIEELHTVVRVGSSFVHNGGGSLRKDPNWSYLRTRNNGGQVFTIGMDKKHIWECEVGQTIAVLRQGTNARVSSEGCEKTDIADE